VKILTIIGARPQFIKASMVSRAIAAERGLQEVILHTGQHFDANMSDVFFGELNLPRPQHQLGINSGGHGEMTGRMLAGIERVIGIEEPDRVLVYGDTNSTLAGALAAVKLHVPVAHIEAGLRSFNMRMPEEINRILTDQVSDTLFCPTDIAIQNLQNEGFEHKSVEMLKVGDVMQDSALYYKQYAKSPAGLSIQRGFILATLHRAENTDDRDRLKAIVEAMNQLHDDTAPVVLPLHPRTRAAISKFDLQLDFKVIEPVGYLEMIWLLQHCGLVLTDSGGVQKESFFFGKPCVTLRDQTEWLELVSAGANRLAGADRDTIIETAKASIGLKIEDNDELYGGGSASRKITAHLAAISCQP
jgi:UDP-GlcNAc3NAcA epimerase